MKRTRSLLCAATIAVFSAAYVLASEPVLKFTAYIADAHGARFKLTNTRNGESSWVSAGQTFAGYVVKRYDDKSEVLMVAKDGAEIRLQLARSQVLPVVAQLPPERKEGILKNLRRLAAAADQYRLERGAVAKSYEDLVGPGKYVRDEIVPVEGESYRAINFQAEKMEVRTSSGHTVTYLR